MSPSFVPHHLGGFLGGPPQLGSGGIGGVPGSSQFTSSLLPPTGSGGLASFTQQAQSSLHFQAQETTASFFMSGAGGIGGPTAGPSGGGVGQPPLPSLIMPGGGGLYEQRGVSALTGASSTTMTGVVPSTQLGGAGGALEGVAGGGAPTQQQQQPPSSQAPAGGAVPPQAAGGVGAAAPLPPQPPALPMFQCPRRPNHGVEGRSIVLRANHFKVSIPGGTIHYYNIDIQPDKCPRKVNRCVYFLYTCVVGTEH